MLTKIAFTFLLFLIASLSGGCAFVDQRIDLPYAQLVSGCNGKGVIEIEKPQVSLLQKDGLTIVGYVRNGFMMHTADVLATNDVGDWVVLALSKELKAAGYQVRTVSALSGSNVGVRINIKKVFADMVYSGINAQVNYVLTLSKDRRVIRGIRAGGRGSFMTYSSMAESYARALEIALQDSMKELIPRIVTTIQEGLK